MVFCHGIMLIGHMVIGFIHFALGLFGLVFSSFQTNWSQAQLVSDSCVSGSVRFRLLGLKLGWFQTHWSKAQLVSDFLV